MTPSPRLVLFAVRGFLCGSVVHLAGTALLSWLRAPGVVVWHPLGLILAAVTPAVAYLAYASIRHLTRAQVQAWLEGKFPEER